MTNKNKLIKIFFLSLELALLRANLGKASTCHTKREGRLKERGEEGGSHYLLARAGVCGPNYKESKKLAIFYFFVH